MSVTNLCEAFHQHGRVILKFQGVNLIKNSNSGARITCFYGATHANQC